MGFRAVLVLASQLIVAYSATVVSLDSPVAAHKMSWVEYLTQDFYRMALVPLLLTTVTLAWLARPSTTDELPPGFQHFKWSYLSVWCICVAADWLQGPYVYALYSAYGFSSHEIAELFVAGFGASMVFGCFVGSIADRFGRKQCCVWYCILYIISCMTKHCKSYEVLMLGRITGGIATSMLFSSFECWMVAEHFQRNRFSGGLLSYMFGLMYQSMYGVAIASGLVGQFAADSVAFRPIHQGSSFYIGGDLMPFDLSIVCLLVGLALIVALWGENYGEQANLEGGSVLNNLKVSGALLYKDRRILILGLVVACFEGSMFAFVFNWTPALESKTVPPPYGVIFSMMMMACMCGASCSTLLGGRMKPILRLQAAFVTALVAFCFAAGMLGGVAISSLMLTFATFLVFEFCVGLYFPSIGEVKSDLVPESVRGTMYNIFRVPLNAIVVGLLLSNITAATCFKMIACFMGFSTLAISSIGYSSPTEATKLVDATTLEQTWEKGSV